MLVLYWLAIFLVFLKARSQYFARSPLKHTPDEQRISVRQKWHVHRELFVHVEDGFSLEHWAHAVNYVLVVVRGVVVKLRRAK